MKTVELYARVRHLLAVVFGLLSAYAVVAISAGIISLSGGDFVPGSASDPIVSAIKCTIPAIVGAALGHYFRRKRLARTQPTQRS